MGQALSSEFARPEAVGDRPASPCGPAGSPGLSAQGLDFALFDEFAAPELLDLPVQVADFRHGPPPGAGQSWGRRPLRTAQGSPGKSEGEPANQRVRTGGGGTRFWDRPPSPHGGPGPSASRCPGRTPPTPVEPRGPALRTVAWRGLGQLPPLGLRLGLSDSPLSSALGLRHHRGYFRPRRGSKGRPGLSRTGSDIHRSRPFRGARKKELRSRKWAGDGVWEASLAVSAMYAS